MVATAWHMKKKHWHHHPGSCKVEVIGVFQGTYLFKYPQVIEAIKREAESLVPVIEVSTNPGIVWEVWKNVFGQSSNEFVNGS